MVKNLKLKLDKYRFDTIISESKEIKNINMISSDIIIKNLPEQFKGQDIWKEYMNPVPFQGICGSCWAWASTNCLSNRIKLKSLNRLHPDLSAVYVLLCDISYCQDDEECINLEGSEFDVEKINILYSEGILEKGCTGNTLENVWEFLYKYGSVETKCVNYEISEVDEEKILPICSEVSGLKLDMCGDYVYDIKNSKESGKPARFYRSIACYQIPGISSQGGSDLNIMSDIYINGPVTTGFIIYPDFYKKEWGEDIYEADPDQKSLGGHAVNIVGWGEQNGKKFWWIENTWGEDWGANGYFKMIRGVNNCGIEENVICGIPDLFYSNNFNFTNTYVSNYITMENSLQLKRLGIDYGNLQYGFSGFDTRTGFTRRALQTYTGFDFSPLISIIEIELLLDTNENVGDTNNKRIIENFCYLNENKSFPPEYIFLIIFTCFIFLFMIGICYFATIRKTKLKLEDL